MDVCITFLTHPAAVGVTTSIVVTMLSSVTAETKVANLRELYNSTESSHYHVSEKILPMVPPPYVEDPKFKDMETTTFLLESYGSRLKEIESKILTGGIYRWSPRYLYQEIACLGSELSVLREGTLITLKAAADLLMEGFGSCGESQSSDMRKVVDAQMSYSHRSLEESTWTDAPTLTPILDQSGSVPSEVSGEMTQDEGADEDYFAHFEDPEFTEEHLARIDGIYEGKIYTPVQPEPVPPLSEFKCEAQIIIQVEQEVQPVVSPPPTASPRSPLPEPPYDAFRSGKSLSVSDLIDPLCPDAWDIPYVERDRVHYNGNISNVLAEQASRIPSLSVGSSIRNRLPESTTAPKPTRSPSCRATEGVGLPMNVPGSPPFLCVSLELYKSPPYIQMHLSTGSGGGDGGGGKVEEMVGGMVEEMVGDGGGDGGEDDGESGGDDGESDGRGGDWDVASGAMLMQMAFGTAPLEGYSV